MFGSELRRIRLERGWSQQALAEAAGMTLNYVGNLERGEQGPSLHALLLLAQGLSVDAPTLLRVFDRDVVRRLRLK